MISIAGSNATAYRTGVYDIPSFGGPIYGVMVLEIRNFRRASLLFEVSNTPNFVPVIFAKN
jgi:hypothetical protein